MVWIFVMGIRFTIVIMMLFSGGPSLSAQGFAWASQKHLVLCEGLPSNSVLPNFSSSNCEPAQDSEISPYKKLLWLKTTINVPQALLDANIPLGFFISGKAASVVYLNGQRLGQNGTPATDAENETPGKMDAVLYLPRHFIKKGPNELVIQMSGHHSYIPLHRPIHMLAIGPFSDPRQSMLQRYLPSFFPLGILVLGAFYFGALATRRREDKRMLLVPLLALFAAGQLVAEASRGLFAYEYPFHDIRLILVLVFAAASGACLLQHITLRFVQKRTALITVGAFALAMIPVYFTDGFDGKSLFAILSPATIGALITAWAAVRRQPMALAYTVVLAIFCTAIYSMPYQFMDLYFYYLVAGLLLFLFGQQTFAIAKEKRRRAEEKARADRLQFIIDESAEKHAPTNIKVNHLGKVEIIPTDQVCFCKGARDYVELVTANARNILHNGSLTELEKELPATFLRVHRSFIVNTTYIQSLEREPSGSGNLILTTGELVPVSRRIMPSVRKALQ